MKKFIVLLLALILVLAVASSCGGGGDKGGNETEGVGGETTSTDVGTNDEPKSVHIDDLTDTSKYYKFIKFDLPEDLRQAAVDYMYEQASVEWICAESFGVKEEWANWGINLDFQKGVKYTGQPYANSQVNVALFKRVLDDGKYTSPSTSWDAVHGSQCVSSILNALQQVMIVDGWSYTLNPGSEAFQGIKVGSYAVEKKAVNSETPTRQVCETNGTETMYESYALLQKGDTLLTVNEWVHARMVVEVTVERNSSGVINPRRSVVKCIEQTNSFDKSRNDGVKTTWYVDHVYTFEKLYTDGYLPATFEAYTTGISHIPYITLDAENTPNVLAKEMIAGNVRSNYPVRYVVLEIFDESGKIAKEYTVRGAMNDYAYGLRKYSYNLFGDGLEKGNYTFVMTAGIAAGEIEFERVQFTVE